MEMRVNGKRILAFVMGICLLISSVISVNAEESGGEVKKIPVRFSDQLQKTESLEVMVNDKNVYANAEELGKRLGYQVEVSEEKAVIYNREVGIVPLRLTEFYFDSTKVRHMLFTRMVDDYEAPFASVRNEDGAWIPMEYALLLLGSSLLVVENEVCIDMPQKNIIDIFTDLLKNQQRYLFDWEKDFGYTELDWKVIGMSSHLVNLFHSFLKKDGASWVQFVQMLALDSSAFDAKYGEDIAMLFCTQSDTELKTTVQEMKDQLQFITAEGPLGKTLSALEKQEKTDVAALYQTCKELREKIDGSNSSVAVYNRAYQALEKACDEAAWFSNTGGKILEVQRGVSEATSFMSTIFTVAEIVGYGKEFQNQDAFSVQALKDFAQSTGTDTTMSKVMKDSIADYTGTLESNLLLYSASRYLKENVDSWVMSATELGSALGTEATLLLIAWDLASGNIPFISNGISAADKFELALYASLMQSDAGFWYRDMRDRAFEDISALTPEKLYRASEACYTYLKACYITRDAAVASLEGKTENIKQQIQPLIDEQNAINEEIAGYLVKLRNADQTNETLCYGFLPEDSEEYLRAYEPDKFVESIGEIFVTDDSERLYAEVLDMFYNNILSGWEDDNGDYSSDFYSFTFPMYYSDPTYIDKIGYQFLDLDGNGIEELIIGIDEYRETYQQRYKVRGIIDLYTYADGEIIHLASGGERWGYYLCENGAIREEGSGGAASHYNIYYRLPENGSELVALEEVFSEPSDNWEDTYWYYRTNDENQMKISEEKTYEIVEQWPDIIDLELTIFSEYKSQK